MRADDWEQYQDEVAQDLLVSAELFERHWPTVRGLCGCVGDLVSFERPDRAMGKLRALDLSSGIDYMAQTKSGGHKMVGARVQGWKEPYWRFASFTIRLSRWTGAPTEWAKQARAFKNHETLPDLTVQLYVDRHRLLIGYGAIATRQLIAYVDAGTSLPPGARFDVRDVRGGNQMMVVWWDLLRRDGVEIVTSGEERLRSRRQTSSHRRRPPLDHDEPAVPPGFARLRSGELVGLINPDTGRCAAHSYWWPHDRFRCAVSGCPGSKMAAS